MMKVAAQRWMNCSRINHRWVHGVLTLCMVVSVGVMTGLYSAESWAAEPVVQQGRVEKQVDPEIQRQAEVLLGKIMQANEVPRETVEKFEMIESEELNAATDGKKMYFTSALWNQLTTDDQRAFVLSHELAHISLNHVPKAMVRRVGLFGISKYLSRWLDRKESKKNEYWQTASQVGLVLTELKFSRRAEYKADSLGLQYMAKSGYDTQGAVQTLEILDKASPASTPQFLRSHPLSKNRIRRLAEQYDTVSLR